ncbi:MAG: hypothetical protein ACYC69_02125 [Thermodesulfovibrionales bacterium]
MSFLPEGERVRRSTAWISEQRLNSPEADLGAVISETSVKFDLSPEETEVLLDFYSGSLNSAQ